MTPRNLVPVLIVATSLSVGLGLTASAIENPQAVASAGESPIPRSTTRWKPCCVPILASPAVAFGCTPMPAWSPWAEPCPTKIRCGAPWIWPAASGACGKSVTAWWSNSQSRAGGRAGTNLAGPCQVVSRLARSVPSATVSPAVTWIATTRPAVGEGISSATLPVSSVSTLSLSWIEYCPPKAGVGRSNRLGRANQI